MGYSKLFLYCNLSFIGGIFLNSFLKIPQPTSLFFLILILVLIIFIKFKKLVTVTLCVLFLFAGIWRHQIAELRIINDELRKFNDYQELITLSGIVIKEPDVRENNVKLELLVESINSTSISGKALITTFKYPKYEYGDRLKITGKLETPKEFPDFNYKNYLAKDGIYSVMNWPKPKIELLERGNYRGLFPIIYAKILKFKNELRKSIEQNLSPPQSSILGAMILGDKQKISEEWKNKLNIAGLRHITAISGLHVTVLTTILMSFLLLLGFWRQQAFYFTITFITLFIIMTGLQPSAIRAGIMGSLFLLAQYFGRMSVSSRAIVFAAAIMLIQNPLLLRLDVGFQLSFLAIMGIIYLLPIFKEWLKFIPSENLKSILAMTFSAYLFTLPILIYNFGYISLVAPITNILIVPSLYWIMILGFIFGIIGIAWGTLGWILSFPAWFLLTYLTKVVDLFSQSWTAKTLENVHWIWLMISYLILALATQQLNKKFNQPIFLR